jgi:type IV pilus assembly protein PilC
VASFKYRAVDRQGKDTEGVMAAADVGALEQLLEGHGYWLVNAVEQQTGASASVRHRAVKQQNLIEFSIHMQHLLSAGVPLARALTSVAEEAPDPEFRVLLKSLLSVVQSGVPLHEAMRAHQSSFPEMVINMLEAGEASGSLSETFAELRSYLEWVAKIQADTRKAMIYPMMIMVAMALFMIVLFTFVIPKFSTVLENLDVALPAVTVALMSVSEVAVSSWWIWLPLVVGLPVGIALAIKNIAGAAYKLDLLKLHLPVVGELIRMIVLSRFAHTCGFLLRAGLPLLQCLSLCQRVVGNQVLAQALVKTERAVSEGCTVTESISQHPIFPPMVRQMISVGEEAGKLDHVLTTLSGYYDEEIPRRVGKVFGIMEPVLTLTLVGVVGFVALALFLPLMSLMGGMR